MSRSYQIQWLTSWFDSEDLFRKLDLKLDLQSKGLTLFNLLMANNCKPYLTSKHMIINMSNESLLQWGLLPISKGLLIQTSRSRFITQEVWSWCAKNTALERGSLACNPCNEFQIYQLYDGMNNSTYHIKLLRGSNRWVQKAF